MKLIKRTNEGELLPRFYGIAWYDFMREEQVCLPIPLNKVATIVRRIWHWLKSGGFFAVSALDRQLIEARRAGYKTGYEAAIRRQEPMP